MIRFILLISVAGLSHSTASAQTIMDGTDRKLSELQRQAFKDAADVISVDPYRVEMRRLFVSRSGMLCGEANIPNKRGGMNGYAPFYVDLPKHNGLIAIEIGDPGFTAQLKDKIAGQCSR